MKQKDAVQRGYRTGMAFSQRVRLLQPLFSRAQEGRCPQAYLWSETFEQSAYKKTVQIAYDQENPCARSPKRLVYLSWWLILAQSESELLSHRFRTVLFSHLESLALTVNQTKSSWLPSQSISFLGIELDSVAMTAHLSTPRPCLTSSHVFPER